MFHLRRRISAYSRSASYTNDMDARAVSGSVTEMPHIQLSQMFPDVTPEYVETLTNNPEFSEALLNLLNNCSETHRKTIFSYFQNNSRLNPKTAAVTMAHASQALEDGCRDIRERLERLGEEARGKLTSFDSHINKYKSQVYAAIGTALSGSHTVEGRNRNFWETLQSLKRDDNQFYDALNQDRAPWIRKALNAITWTLSILLSVTIPFAGMCVMLPLHLRNEARTRDFGFFARPESAAKLRATELNVANELEAYYPETWQPIL